MFGVLSERLFFFKMEGRPYPEARGSLHPTHYTTLGPSSHPLDWVPSWAIESSLIPQLCTSQLWDPRQDSQPFQTCFLIWEMGRIPTPRWRKEAKYSSTEWVWGQMAWIWTVTPSSGWTFLCLSVPISKSGITRALPRQLLRSGLRSRWLRDWWETGFSPYESSGPFPFQRWECVSYCEILKFILSLDWNLL